MSLHDLLFTIGNILVMPFWILMIALPRWTWTRRIAESWWGIGIVAVMYVVALVGSFFVPGGGAPTDLSSLGTAMGIAALLGTPVGAATGWLHFLAFDLFVGRWAYLDSREKNLNPWLVTPCLFFILMTGPFGLLLYLGLRMFNGRKDSSVDRL
jgi:hypothetical protein